MGKRRGWLANPFLHAGLTQLVECNLPKVKVAGSNPVSRSGNGSGQ